MGPEATLVLFEEILKNTPAQKDQDHLRVIIDCNPKIPDRTLNHELKEESPISEMVKSAQILENAGVDFILIPCVSAHVYLVQLQKEIGIPVISILDVLIEEIVLNFQHLETIGLIATDTTIKSQMLNERLSECGINTLVPEQNEQKRVMKAIFGVKSSVSSNISQNASSTFEDNNRSFLDVAESLIQRNAQGIIAGCTEIPIFLKAEAISVPLINPLELLAKKAIKLAKFSKWL